MSYDIRDCDVELDDLRLRMLYEEYLLRGTTAR